jgi:hypothetical protein
MKRWIRCVSGRNDPFSTPFCFFVPDSIYFVRFVGGFACVANCIVAAACAGSRQTILCTVVTAYGKIGYAFLGFIELRGT